MNTEVELTEEEVEDEGLEAPEDQEELEFRRQAAEGAKIGGVEQFMVLATAAIADTFEIFAGLIGWIPVLGWMTWFFAYAFGLFVSGALFVWALLRGVTGGIVVKKAFKRLVTLVGGFVADAMTAGILPMRTITLWLTIRLNNKDQSGELSRVTKLLKKVV